MSVTPTPTVEVANELVGSGTVSELAVTGSRRWSVGVVLAAGYLGLLALLALSASILPIPDPDKQDLLNTLGPRSSGHWLGTDDLGRDLLSRLIWGVRTSLLAALTAVVVAILVAVPAGLLAGYVRGWFDQVISRLTDVILTVPALILLLAAQTALQTGITGQMVVLGLIFSPRIVRVVRAETIRQANEPFVLAGAMSGNPRRRILLRYLLPGVRSQLSVQVSYLFGLSLLVEAGISFLGIGVRPPQSSLGTLLIGASALLSTRPEVVLIPAAVLTLLILSLNYLGDVLARGSGR